MADRIEIDLVPKITAATMAALKGQLGGLLSAGGGVVSQVGGLIGKGAGAGSSAAALGGALGTVGAVMGGIGTAITTITETAKELVTTIANLAKAASPVAFQQFEFVLKDLHAVVGRMFVPVLQQITEFVRIMADFLLAILPSAGQMRTVMKELDPIFKDLRIVLAELAPILKEEIRLHLELLRVLIEVNKVFPGALSSLARILEFFGRGKGTLPESTGMGGRPAAFSGIAEYGRQIRLQTAQLPGQGPEEETAKNTAESARLLAQIAATLITDKGRRAVQTGANVVQIGAQAVIDAALAPARAVAGRLGF